MTPAMQTTHRDVLRRDSGLAAGGLFFSIFSCLILLVTVFQILAGTGLPDHLRLWIYAGSAAAIVLLAIGIYRGFRFFKNRRFQKGAKDTLYLMALRRESLLRDVGRLEEALQNEGAPGPDMVHHMLRDKLAEIVAGDCRTLGDVQKKYRSSGLKKMRTAGFRTLFHSPEEYDQLPEPPEFKLIADSVARFYYQLEPQFDSLKAARRTLFTVMGDYARVLPPAEKSVQAIEEKYRYNPPGHAKATRIAFALKMIDYFKKDADAANASPTVAKTRASLTAWVGERLPAAHDALAAYNSAWQSMIEAYDDLAPLPRGLDIR